MSGTDFFSIGYALAGLALALVSLYFLAMMLLMKLLQPQTTVVARYEPPTSVSPGVAAWLLERGELPRAMASAIVSMTAKSYVKIEQEGDLYSVTQLGPDVSFDLAPEEDALARRCSRSMTVLTLTSHLRSCARRFERSSAP